MTQRGFGFAHTPHVAPCEVCRVPTTYTHDGMTRKGAKFRPRWICQSCHIAELACTRLHGIESEQRAKLDRLVALETELDAAYRERNRLTQLRLDDGPVSRHIRRLGEEKERLQQETMYLPTDPLGLDRISDDRDFIQRFLQGFPEAHA